MATTEVRNLLHFSPAPEHELQATDDDSPKLAGYAAVFGRESVDLGGFVEIIEPGAFADSLASGNDFRALVDHDHSRILARTSAGTLRLAEDASGLRVDVDLPDTTYARDLLENVRRRNVRGMSFGFIVPEGGDKWTREGDRVVRRVSRVELLEVTATSIPAYPSTTLAEARVDPAVAQRAASLAPRPRLKRAERLLVIASMRT